MKITRPHLAKLDPKGLKVIFIGYEPRSKAYKLYDPAGKQAHVSCDVVFDDSTFWQWNDVVKAVQTLEQFMVEYLITKLREEEAQHRAL